MYLGVLYDEMENGGVAIIDSTIATPPYDVSDVFYTVRGVTKLTR